MKNSMLFPSGDESRPVDIAKPRFEILGVFGSGKTTLAAELSRSGQMRALNEQHLANAFWGARQLLSTFGYLGYDLSFLLHHAFLVQSSLEGPDAPDTLCCDWSFFSDKLWASSRLDADEYQAYMQVHQAVARRCGKPTAYLYIDESPAVVLQRIQLRGRPEERDVTLQMLQRVSDLLADETAKLVDVPVLRITSASNITDILAAVSKLTGSRTPSKPRNA